MFPPHIDLEESSTYNKVHCDHEYTEEDPFLCDQIPLLIQVDLPDSPSDSDGQTDDEIIDDENTGCDVHQVTRLFEGSSLTLDESNILIKKCVLKTQH